MRKKHILQIMEDLDVGGTEKILLKWILAFDREKFDITVISFHDGILRTYIEKAGIQVEILTKSKPYDIEFLFRLIKRIKEVRPDVIHCRNGMRAIIYGGIAAKFCRIPLITSIHGRTHYLRINFRTRIWLFVIKLSAVVITVSNGIRQELIKLGRINAAKCKVIYNGIEVNKIEKINQKVNKKEKIGLENDKFVIGTIGSLRKLKAQKYLIEAMPLVLKHIPEAILVLIGEGEEKRDLQQLTKNLNLGNRVKFLGYREDASDLIALFDIFVLPSASEGFPNVLLEAAISKKPIIATRVGGVEEFLKNGYSALLVEPENSKDIAGKIIELKEDRDLMNKIADNSYNIAVNNFSLNNFIKNYEEIYLAV